MRNLFANVFHFRNSTTPSYGSISVEKLVRRTMKEVKALKAEGGNYEEARQFASFIFDQHELGVHGAYDESIEDMADDHFDSERRLKHIDENRSAYIESEKKAISEKLYRLIDKLAAAVQRMKGQTKEHNSYNA
ncbi:MAG: hypothetical protein R8G66_02825 [Cytophagales bacterium]|nr:hypothetical protein [Cytophagales bacterium]